MMIKPKVCFKKKSGDEFFSEETTEKKSLRFFQSLFKQRKRKKSQKIQKLIKSRKMYFLSLQRRKFIIKN